jgi:hypothetical protein
MKNLLKDKEEIYQLVSFAANGLLVMGTMFAIIYLAFPLLGGKLSWRAVIHYGSWILVALSMKSFLKRLKKELPIRKFDYFLIWLCISFNILSWVIYPFNIILIIFFILLFVASYKARLKKMKLAKSE